MRENFDHAVSLVLGLEGGFVDHPRDPGGATAMGITRATLALFRGRPVSVQEVRSLGREEAVAIYRRFYWDAVLADRLPHGIDLVVFDCAVHSGPRRAVTLLQRALGVVPDGIVGPVTLAAARSAQADPVIRTVERLRLGFLARLPGAAVFGRGWRSRVGAVTRAALALAGTPAPRLPLPPPTTQEKDMPDVKSILASRTVWSNIVGLTALALSVAGFDTSGLDSGRLAEAGLQVVAGASFVCSTLFRVLATRRIGLG